MVYNKGKKGGMSVRRKWLKRLGQGLCVLGALWFCMPVLHGGFAEGSVFGVGVCLLGLALLSRYGRLVEKGGWKKFLARFTAVCYCLGLLWAGVLTALIVSYQTAAPPAGLDVIVLGSRVYSAERMGVSLQNRVERAAEYLRENPEARCTVTGGQGANEPCAESLTAKNALTRLGVDPSRIYSEDRSRNTRENLVYAMETARENGLGTRVAVVSQSFHLYRAVRLAKSAGFEAYGLAARTDPIIYPSYYGRELLSLTKYFVEELWKGANP